MKINTKGIKFDGANLIIPIPVRVLEEAKDLAGNKGTLTVDIQVYKSKRGITANSLMWLALRFLAEKYNTTKEELYLKYLRENGIFQYYEILPEALESARQAFRIVDVEGENDGKLRIKAYEGSSVYDTKEFSYFLSRIVEDAEEEGFNGNYDLQYAITHR